jgi:hypothetical protein
VYRVVTARVAQSVRTKTSLPEPTPEDVLPLDSVDLVPLPSPLEDESPATVFLDAFAPLENVEEESTLGGFSLNKGQSFWLLNLVSFLYGTNTTCAFPARPLRCEARMYRGFVRVP